jgi:hypothetical protein
MSQIYRDKVLKYRVMSLVSDNIGAGHEDHKFTQFLPYFGNNHFGDYILDQESTLVTVGCDAKYMKKLVSPIGLGENLEGVKKYALTIARKDSINQEEGHNKHILFKFDMISLQYSFVLQN